MLLVEILRRGEIARGDAGAITGLGELVSPGDTPVAVLRTAETLVDSNTTATRTITGDVDAGRGHAARVPPESGDRIPLPGEPDENLGADLI